jgi:hypothetical protein
MNILLPVKAGIEVVEHGLSLLEKNHAKDYATHEIGVFELNKKNI